MELQAKDLRIGNYFNWSEISSIGIGMDVTTEENHYRHNQLKEPIPLTEDWLVKFGFVNHFKLPNIRRWYHVKWPLLELYFVIDRGVILPCYNNKLSIDTVHHLQNWWHSNTLEELVFNNDDWITQVSKGDIPGMTYAEAQALAENIGDEIRDKDQKQTDKAFWNTGNKVDILCGICSKTFDDCSCSETGRR